jgi:hypothetical protein
VTTVFFWRKESWSTCIGTRASSASSGQRAARKAPGIRSEDRIPVVLCPLLRDFSLYLTRCSVERELISFIRLGLSKKTCNGPRFFLDCKQINGTFFIVGSEMD